MFNNSFNIFCLMGCLSIYVSLGTGIPIQPRHSMTTRFFLTCISAYHFHKDVTLDGLHDFIADDAANLYHNGLEVPCMYKTFQIDFVCEHPQVVFIGLQINTLVSQSVTATFRSARESRFDWFVWGPKAIGYSSEKFLGWTFKCNVFNACMHIICQLF